MTIWLVLIVLWLNKRHYRCQHDRKVDQSIAVTFWEALFTSIIGMRPSTVSCPRCNFRAKRNMRYMSSAKLSEAIMFAQQIVEDLSDKTPAWSRVFGLP